MALTTILVDNVSSILGTVALGILITLIVKFATFWISYRKMCAGLAGIPSKPSHWLWGHLLELPPSDERTLQYQTELLRLFPKFCVQWISALVPFVIVHHPETLRAILRTSEPKSRQIYGMLIPWLGDGLLLSKGEKWLRMRRLLTPGFHFDILKPYMGINNRSADIFVNKVKTAATKGVSFETFEFVSMYTLDIMLKCSCSYDTDCQTLGEQHPYVKAVNEMARLLTDRYFKPWLYNTKIYAWTSNGKKLLKYCDYVHSVTDEIIQTRRKELNKVGDSVDDDSAPKKKRYLDFLDILLKARDEDGGGMTDREIRDEVDTFLFEGHDTTASGISWTLYHLAKYPEHQRKVQEEIDAILDGRESADILWDDLGQLNYLTMCIKESLRLCSPVGFIQRELSRDLVVNNVNLPAGSTISVLIWSNHHNQEIWDNPTEYRPERFSQENSKGRDPYAFVPFSAGPRNCIGQNFAMHEIKTIVSRILREYTLEVDPKFTVERKLEVVTRSKYGIHLIPTPRKRS